MKKIIAVHLYNDYSGSPLVLSTAIKSFVAKGMEVDVLTSKDGLGFLSNLEGVNYQYFKYRFFQSKAKRLFALLWSQALLSFKILKYLNEDVIIYVNTLLPFGAAIAGRLIGKKVIYHIHETTVNPPVLKRFLKKVATACSSEVVFVSHYLKQKETLPNVPAKVVYNCLSKEFVEVAKTHLIAQPLKPQKFTVLMICSLKAYKGVNEFVQLAERLPEQQFVMVLNSNQNGIQQYFQGQTLPENLVVFPSQKNVHSFYQEAHLVVNLSHPDKWVETFGMTLLEAMNYGLPVIAPPVGGPVELVENGFNGYKIDQRNLDEIAHRVKLIAHDDKLYRVLSSNASKSVQKFSIDDFSNRLEEIVIGAIPKERKKKGIEEVVAQSASST